MPLSRRLLPGEVGTQPVPSSRRSAPESLVALPQRMLDPPPTRVAEWAEPKRRARGRQRRPFAPGRGQRVFPRGGPTTPGPAPIVTFADWFLLTTSCKSGALCRTERDPALPGVPPPP